MQFFHTNLLYLSSSHILLLEIVDRDFSLVTSGTSEYTLAKEDVGRRLAFIYIPINFEGMSASLLFEVFSLLFTIKQLVHRMVTWWYSHISGQEGESVSIVSGTVRQGMPIYVYILGLCLFIIFIYEDLFLVSMIAFLLHINFFCLRPHF